MLSKKALKKLSITALYMAILHNYTLKLFQKKLDMLPLGLSDTFNETDKHAFTLLLTALHGLYSADYCVERFFPDENLIATIPLVLAHVTLKQPVSSIEAVAMAPICHGYAERMTTPPKRLSWEFTIPCAALFIATEWAFPDAQFSYQVLQLLTLTNAAIAAPRILRSIFNDPKHAYHPVCKEAKAQLGRITP